MRRSTYFWGTILVLVGVLLMLDNLDILSVRLWDILWPSLLVLLGIWILVGSFSSRRLLESEHLLVPHEGATQVHLRLNHGAGRLRLRSGSNPDVLAEGDFVGGLDLRSQKIGDALDVEMSVPTRNYPIGPWFFGRRSLDWLVELNREVLLRMDIRTGANEADLDLTAMQVTELHLSTGASSTRLTLPESAGHTRATVESGAASVSIRIPQNVGARIRSESGLASITVDRTRFERVSSGLYQSVDYDSASNKVDLDVQTGVGSVDIR
jgi:hypothetical protein